MTTPIARRWRPPRILLPAWLGLLALLALTVFGAYQPLGAFNTVLAMTIALIKALIVLVIFMELRERNALTIAFAAAGFFWLAIMLWLALADFVTRPNFPPGLGTRPAYGAEVSEPFVTGYFQACVRRSAALKAAIAA